MKMNKKKMILLAVPVVAGGIAAALLLFSGPRMRVQPGLRAFETGVNLPPEKSVFYTPGGTDEISTEITATSTNLEKGKVYYGYYCIFCHGGDGKGNGPVGQSYMPKPTDLTGPGIKNYSSAGLYRRSFTGTGHEPVLERVVPEEFRKYILVYIRDGLKE